MSNDSGIYCYENLINGKKYIGQSQNLRKRKNRHESNFKISSWKNTSPRENHLLWNAIKKYGREKFSYCVLEFCEKEMLDELEIYYVKKLSSHYTSNGYNLSWGGGTMRGYKYSEDTKRRMSESHKGKTHTDDTKKNIQLSIIGTKKVGASSDYHGVYRLKPSGKRKQVYWITNIKTKKLRYTKCFKKEVDAAMEYNRYIIENKLPYPLNVIGDVS